MKCVHEYNVTVQGTFKCDLFHWAFHHDRSFCRCIRCHYIPIEPKQLEIPFD